MASRPQGLRGFGDGLNLLEGAQARVPLDCNGKPLTYIPIRQLGRCWFDKTPHFWSDWCFRWYVLRDDEQCRGGP